MKKHYSERQLMAFVDDVLNETDYNLIKEHLETCGQCARIVEGMQSVFIDLDRLETPPLNDELAGNTKKLWKLLQQNGIQLTENNPALRLKRGQRYFAIGAMVAGLTLGILFGDIARQGIIAIESPEQSYPVVLQDNGASINDSYVSLIISEGREDL